MLRLLLESGFTELRVEIAPINVNDKPVYTRYTKIYKEETKTYYDACFLDRDGKRVKLEACKNASLKQVSLLRFMCDKSHHLACAGYRCDLDG